SPLQRKDGSIVGASTATFPQTDASGVVTGLIGTATDLSGRHGFAEALRASAERFGLLFDSNPQPMWVYDTETLAFLHVNDAAIAKYGYQRDEFLAMTILDIRPASDRGRLLAHTSAPKDDFRNAGEWRHRTKAGEEIEVEVSAHSIEFSGRPAVLISALDVTERKNLDQQLRESMKMEALGRLAGGIAHDFNNLLTVIIGYTDVLLHQMAEPDPVCRRITDIQNAGLRAAELTRQLLTFSRRQSVETTTLNLDDLVAAIEPLIGRLMPENITMTSKRSDEPALVTGDKGQLEQVLVNLCLNARDAMPEGGDLNVETGVVELTSEYADSHLDVQPGPYVSLVVSDTGTGISSEVRTHLFEPFFTTREAGKGTGLGLSIVYGIVKRHNGTIWVYSEPGRGSTFKVYFPLVTDAGRPGASKPVDTICLSGSETVLVVEDQSEVREFIGAVLSGYGYRVLEARSGTEGIQILGNLDTRIDLLITDIILPGASGWDVAECARTTRPHLKIILTSGYTGSILRAGAATDLPGRLLEKPFTARALAVAVRESLNAARK
ncbi:MAG: ATP-binding protein, partial [Acidobacteriota bacterium]